MGYTHYWTIARDATQLEWTEIMLLAAQIAEKSNVRIDFGGTGDDHLFLNGVDPHDYETFCLYKHRPPTKSWQSEDQRGWDFCKTARKPYDVVVTAILTAINKRVPGYLTGISSDGTTEEWEDGRQLAALALGEIFEVPFRDITDVEVRVTGPDPDTEGRYKIEVDATGLGDGDIAGAALDCFHDNVPIKVLEDFEIKVIRYYETEITEGEDYERHQFDGRTEFLGKVA